MNNEAANQLDLFNPLEHFEQRIPYTARCGNAKQFEHILPKKEAKSYPYIQINFPHVNYIVYDLDYPTAVVAAEENYLPGATLTVVTQESGYAHLLYELYNPIPVKHSKETKALLDHVCYCYKELLCADKVITTQKQLIKNALSSRWKVLEGYKSFTLTELAEHIPDDLKQKRRFEPTTNQILSIKPFEETLQPHSRNCSLFENARFFAYATVNNCSTYDDLYSGVFRYLERLNEVEIPKYFPRKVMNSELRYIAKSISGWTFNKRYQFKQVNRGAMDFDTMEGTYWEPEEFKKEKKRRQKLSAHRTHELQKEATLQKIQKGIKLCLKYEYKLTASNISTLAGVCRQTLYNRDYKEIIKSVHYGVSVNTPSSYALFKGLKNPSCRP